VNQCEGGLHLGGSIWGDAWSSCGRERLWCWDAHGGLLQLLLRGQSVWSLEVRNMTRSVSAVEASCTQLRTPCVVPAAAQTSHGQLMDDWFISLVLCTTAYLSMSNNPFCDGDNPVLKGRPATLCGCAGTTAQVGSGKGTSLRETQYTSSNGDEAPLCTIHEP
jgi:hypothetical protein